MKVLEINSVCGIRSTGRICTDLADMLAAGGHECRVAYGREQAPEKYRKIAIRIGSEAGVRRHGLQSRLFGHTGFYSKGATRAFLKAVDQYRPDIVHLHNLHGYYLHIGLLFDYLKEKQIPVVWTLHDCWAFTGHCVHFAEAGCDQWKTKCTHCAKTKSYPTCWFGDNVKRNFEEKKALFTGLPQMVVVTPSQWLANNVKRSFLGKYPVEVIHNGIDLRVFRPTAGDFRKKYQLENKHIVLGVASAWSRSKGLYDFIELAKGLPDDHRIVLVGLTAKQIAEMPEGILCIERTNNVRELAEIYTAADVFVNPSRQETMGLVTAEALACGTPCVVYDATAVPEVVNETCGSVVKVGDLEALQQEIERIIRERSYSREACLRHTEKYEKTQQFRQYIKLYEKLCGEKTEADRE